VIRFAREESEKSVNSANVLKTFVVCQTLGLLMFSSPRVQSKDGPVAACDVRAYVIDRDPAGLNVRSGPAKNSKIIGNLPNQKVEGIGVHITGSSGDWVRIDLAVEEGGEQEQTFFKGAGWVYSSLLGVSGMAITNGGTNLYQEANTKSRIVARIPGGDDDVIVRGCRGRWLYVEYKKIKGWAAPDTLCANSLTTCV
jgi:SH3-like domain-containing protein